jgi:YVTN family beta-propeller protein
MEVCMKAWRIFVVLLLGICSVAVAAELGDYRIIKTVPIPGDTGWDYLTMDVAARRVYMAHGDRVAVLDADNDTYIGMVHSEKMKGMHGVAVVPELGRGFANSGGTDLCFVFDLKKLEVLAEVPTGKAPDSVTYDPVSRRVFAFNEDGKSVTVIDAKTSKVLETVDLGAKPNFAVADGKGHLFVNLSNASIARIDSRKMTVTDRWPIAPYKGGNSLAIDRKNNRLFVGSYDSIMVVVDATNGKVITTAPIDGYVDSAAFDPAMGLIFFSCGAGDGSLKIIHQDSPDDYSVVQTIKTFPIAKTMTEDPKTHKVFVAAVDLGPVPPPPPPGQPRANRKVIPGTARILVIGK